MPRPPDRPAEPPVYIGTASWAVPREHAAAFPAEGGGLARYAQVFRACEINSTFWRRHRASTFERWHATVPSDFRFAVKIPRTITHEAQLAAPRERLVEFLADVAPLGEKLGPLLVQLAPSLGLDVRRAATFFRTPRALHEGPVACEPRHATWLTPEADRLLGSFDVTRVATDPPRPPGADSPGGSRSLVYVRLHGSPVMYRSPYGEERLARIAARVREEAAERPVWCFFDNTASGAAAGDALVLQRLVPSSRFGFPGAGAPSRSRG